MLRESHYCDLPVNVEADLLRDTEPVNGKGRTTSFTSMQLYWLECCSAARAAQALCSACRLADRKSTPQS
jgi:hypothetical protein